MQDRRVALTISISEDVWIIPAARVPCAGKKNIILNQAVVDDLFPYRVPRRYNPPGCRIHHFTFLHHHRGA